MIYSKQYHSFRKNKYVGMKNPYKKYCETVNQKKRVCLLSHLLTAKTSGAGHGKDTKAA